MDASIVNLTSTQHRARAMLGAGPGYSVALKPPTVSREPRA
jgi:hypothetical protein